MSSFFSHSLASVSLSLTFLFSARPLTRSFHSLLARLTQSRRGETGESIRFVHVCWEAAGRCAVCDQLGKVYIVDVEKNT